MYVAFFQMRAIILAVRLTAGTAVMQHLLSPNGSESETYLIWKAPETPPVPKFNLTAQPGQPGMDHRAEWIEFNEVLHPYVLKDSFVTQTPEIVQVLSITAQQPWVKTICETGFSAGHSAMLFLLANRQAEVYSFGLGSQSYSATAQKFLSKKFGDRFQLTKGNSTTQLPLFRKLHPGVQCDLMFVDGGYDEETVEADIRNFRKMANPMNQVLFVMETPCPAKWCVGRGAAFSKATMDKEIMPVSRLPVNEWHGLSSAWFTPVAKTPPAPASNFETLGPTAFLAAQTGSFL